MADFRYTDSKRVRNSSLVDALFYNANSGDLVVQFHGGRRAGYTGVPLTVADRFFKAASAGKFYNSDIKRFYSGFSIEPNDVLDNVYEPPRPLYQPKAAPGVYKAPKHSYVITGQRTEQFTETVQAASMDEAIAKVKAAGDGVVVRSASVDFDV